MLILLISNGIMGHLLVNSICWLGIALSKLVISLWMEGLINWNLSVYNRFIEWYL